MTENEIRKDDQVNSQNDRIWNKKKKKKKKKKKGVVLVRKYLWLVRLWRERETKHRFTSIKVAPS